MATLSWDSIRSLLIFFGPILLPKAISYYRSIRPSSSSHNLAIQPVPPAVRLALGLLSALSLVSLIKSLPPLAPENLFVLTRSRLQIPVDVLFNRAASVRPDNALTAADAILRGKFVNLESRLLYLQFGPEVLVDCPFCNVDEPKSYFYYALPAILWPHLANLLAITVVTSSAVIGKYGSQWRTLATIAATVLCGIEVYFVSTYNYQANARATRLQDIEFFYWTMRTYRLVVIGALDAILAWVLYLTSTNRAFAQPPQPAEQVQTSIRALNSVKSRLNALGIVKNTALRDDDLRSRAQAYWSHEVRLMSEVMEEREVIEGVNDALQNRINMQKVTTDAETYSQTVLKPLQSPNAEQG